MTPDQKLPGDPATAERGIELLASMRALAGKLGPWFELLPAAVRPEIDWPRPEPLEWTAAERLLADEWDEPVADVLDELEHEPVALSSTGQVHRGVAGGRPVAVKLQRPGAEAAVGADLDAIGALAALGARVVPGIDVAGIATELRERTLEELDHELEAQSQRAFARAYRGHPFIHVPAPDTRRSRGRVLVSEWVDGRPLSALADGPQAERDRAGEALFRFHLGAPHRIGRLHADPHPDNVLLLDDGRIAVLDYGSSTAVDRERMLVTRVLLAAGLASDAEAAHDAFARLGYLGDRSAIDPDMMLAAGRDILAPLLDAGPVEASDRVLGGIMRRLDGDERAWRILRAITVPPGDLLLRRTELSTLLLIARTGACADWGAVGRELWAGERPATELGIAEWDFWSARRR